MALEEGILNLPLEEGESYTRGDSFPTLTLTFTDAETTEPYDFRDHRVRMNWINIKDQIIKQFDSNDGTIEFTSTPQDGTLIFPQFDLDIEEGNHSLVIKFDNGSSEWTAFKGSVFIVGDSTK